MTAPQLHLALPIEKVPTANDTENTGLVYRLLTITCAGISQLLHPARAVQPGEIEWVGKAQQTEAVTGDSYRLMHSLSHTYPQAVARIPQPFGG